MCFKEQPSLRVSEDVLCKQEELPCEAMRSALAEALGTVVHLLACELDLALESSQKINGSSCLSAFASCILRQAGIKHN